MWIHFRILLQELTDADNADPADVAVLVASLAEHGAPLLLAEHMKGLDETSEEQVRNAQHV